MVGVTNLNDRCEVLKVKLCFFKINDITVGAERITTRNCKKLLIV